MSNANVSSDHQMAPSAPAALKYFVAAAALFIAGCSAVFSVRGLGLLFIGSSVAVMIMAASLEIGKLVAASFLYAYWNQINRALRFYLFVAVVVLIGITSLGNYGYLARAFERTHTQITLWEQQIAALEKEIADTQQQIERATGQVSRISDTGREDIARAQQRISELQTALEQSLARLQERRKIAQERRDRDLQTETRTLAERTEVLKQGIAQEEAAVAELNQRLAVLDRAVDAYTKIGGATFFREDHIKKGAELRERQKPERDAIAARIAEHNARLAQLRTQHAQEASRSERAIAAVRDEFARESARLDAEEQELRRNSSAAIAQAQEQLGALQLKGQTLLAAGDTQVEAMHQRIRACQEEIHQLQQQIASMDIGPYRFVARAFQAPADSVVKWLILALVLVFDPLAVSLAVGFNVALLRERRRVPAPALAASLGAASAVGAPLRRNRLALSLNLLVGALTIGILALSTYGGWRAWQNRVHSTHARWIPPSSFAVVTLRPHEFRATGEGTLAEWLDKVAGKPVANTLSQFLQSGFEPQADVYAFAKFPSTDGSRKSDRPVLIAGFVGRVTNPATAEMALARLASQMAESLSPGSTASLPSPVQNRSMIRCGQGRYYDPEGGFFTFGLTDEAAIVMVEFEGDPKAPCVEKEIRAALTRSGVPGLSGAQASASLPARALRRGGPITVWFDSARFFAELPKNAAAQARYQQLQRHLGFDLLLQVQGVRGDQMHVSADYAYRADRFQDRPIPPALEVLAALGPPDAAGLAGRLMDRCADTLEFDSLIERLRQLLGNSRQGAEEVVVEKSIASTRDAQFVLTARFNPQAGPPLVAAAQSLAR